MKFFGQQQKLYLKDTTDFINFIEKTKLPKEVIFVSMSERRDTDIFLNIPPDNQPLNPWKLLIFIISSNHSPNISGYDLSSQAVTNPILIFDSYTIDLDHVLPFILPFETN